MSSRITPTIRKERARIAQLRPKPILVTKRPGIRLKVSDFILGRTETPPPPIETRGGRVMLCELGNGERLYLPTSSKDRTTVITECRKESGRIFADVFSRSAWTTGTEVKEVFLVRDGEEVFPEGKLVARTKNSPAANSPVSKAQLSQRSLVLARGAAIENWLTGESNTSPKSYDWQLTKSGLLHLCHVSGEPVQLLIHNNLGKTTVRVSFTDLGEYKLIGVKVNGTNWEFEVTRDAVQRSLMFRRRFNQDNPQPWSMQAYY